MRRLLVAIALGIILISVYLTIPSAEGYLSPSREPKEILFTSNMQINLVVVGDQWSEEDQEAISSKLIKSYKPILLEQNVPIGVEYNYNYTFVSADDLFATRLYTFIEGATLEVEMPEPIAQWVVAAHPEFGDVRSVAYRIVHAQEVEELIMDNWELADGYTIFFFMPHNDELNYLHTYGMLTNDPDTDQQFLQEGMMGFGGTYRFYFIDLTAGPWIYPPGFVSCEDAQSAMCDQVNFTENKNIYDIASAEESYEIISEYVNNAVSLLYTPSYVYPSFYRLNHDVSIFLIDFTAERELYGAAEEFINRDLIEREFRHLLPYVNWTSSVLGLSVDDLPEDLRDTIIDSMGIMSVDGSDVVIVDSAALIDGLDKWALGELTEEELKELEEKAETTVIIPVFIFVFDNEAYVDQYGLVGLAAPDPTDPSIPCCTIVATSKYDVSLTGQGLTVLAIHETAHVLGLAHPHDGYRPDIGNFVDWFFDWSYTPLTYGAPTANGCGLNELCGMVIAEFGKFNFDAIDRGMVLSILDEAQFNVYDAMLLLDDLGYDSSTTPSEITSNLSAIDSDVEEAKKHFESMNYFRLVTFRDPSSIMNPMDDALDYALRALKTSEQLLKDAKELESLMSEKPAINLDISVTVKQKNKVTLVSVKNNDELPLFGVRFMMEDGNIKFVKARGWDRDRIDQSTVMLDTDNRPIGAGESLTIILVSDDQNALQWSALSKAGNELGKGVI